MPSDEDQALAQVTYRKFCEIWTCFLRHVSGQKDKYGKTDRQTR